MFPIRRRAAVVGERRHRLARGRLRVVVLRAVPRAAARRNLAVPARPGRAVIVTGPAVAGITVAGPVVTSTVVTSTVVTAVAVARPAVTAVAVARAVVTGPG